MYLLDIYLSVDIENICAQRASLPDMLPNGIVKDSGYNTIDTKLSQGYYRGRQIVYKAYRLYFVIANFIYFSNTSVG